ncbi:MAG: transposase [Ignavibacteria bacterium]|nr:transposase [Ignavibacteria bacterium]
MQILNIEEQIIVKDHIISGNSIYYKLNSFIIMPDHVHLLLTPINDNSLRRIMSAIKSVSAKKINKYRGEKSGKVISGHIWQDESYDRIIRNEKELREKMDYILYNSVKKELTEDPERYYGYYYNEFFFE